MRWLLAALAAALVLAGCGEKAEPTGSNSGGGGREPFTVILDYLPNADHAGIYAAQAEGLYAKANLDVKLVVPPDASSPLKLLKAGRADVAISYEPELLLARDAGAESLVSVAALVQEPLTSLMALPSANVHSASDLAGKRVGTAGIAYQHAYLQTILQHAGVDAGSVKETSVGFNLVPAMVSKKVAATLGAYWNYEGIQLARAHKDPVILRMPQLGVPTYDELVVVARRESLDTAGASRPAQRPADRGRRAGRGVARDRQGPPGGEHPGHAAGVLPARHGQPVGLAGRHRVGALRALDAGQPPAQAAALGGAAADERVPRGAGRRRGPVSRRYSPARPAQPS
jgi:ABC-type nitrate/sulfonate/bicarbonate transport system substrate-binding protein